MKFRLAILLAATVSLAAACQQKKAAEEEAPPAPLDTGTAQTMLMRSLQAEEAGDVEAEKADLFPRQPNILSTCAKLRVDNGKMASVAMRDENGQIPKITGVTVSNLRASGEKTWVAQYQAAGNSAYGGSEMFVWANGRWWIKCNI